MSLIKNLIKEPEKKKLKTNDDEGEKDDETKPTEKKPPPMIKTATDLQRLKIEKLMQNPDKPVIIPETPKDRDYMHTVPSFVRNVMGSSAGAGSGEFHVYRHLRRKEYARQKHIQAKSVKEQLDEDFQKKLEDNRRMAEEKTAKKKLWRWKKKERRRQNREKKDKDKEESERLDQQTRHPWSTQERIERENDPFKRYEGDRERHLTESEPSPPEKEDSSPKEDN